MPRSTTLARLTVETSDAHAAIDEALFGPLEFPTAAGYRRFLCLIYGFQAPLEAALTVTPGIDLDFVHDRCRAGRVASDLMTLGLTRREHKLLACRQSVPAFADPAQAFGWFYATERLMLQIESLRPRLANEIPVVYELASQFISSYANIAELRWRQYGAMLDRLARAHGADAIVDAGRAGMASLQSWLAASGAIVRAPAEQLLVRLSGTA